MPLPPGKKLHMHCTQHWVGIRVVWMGVENLAPHLDIWTIQPVMTRYTDYTTLAHSENL